MARTQKPAACAVDPGDGRSRAQVRRATAQAADAGAALPSAPRATVCKASARYMGKRAGCWPRWRRKKPRRCVPDSFRVALNHLLRRLCSPLHAVVVAPLQCSAMHLNTRGHRLTYLLALAALGLTRHFPRAFAPVLLLLRCYGS